MMSRFASLRYAVLAALLFLAPSSPSFAAEAAHLGASAADATDPLQGDRRILVMLKLGPDHFRAGNDYGGGTYGDAVGQATRRRLARKIAHDENLILADSWPMPIIGVDCVIMIVPQGRDLDAVTARISTLQGVAWSQRLNEFHMESSIRAKSAFALNDRLFLAQPAADRWHLAALHKMATGLGVTIAVVDSRIDVAHPDLSGQVATSQDFVAGEGRGAERHGTGVAGIIAARANNSVGIVGVAPGAKLMGLRACWERRDGAATVCDSLSLAKALTYAIEKRANIINMSLSGPSDRLLASLIGIGISRGLSVVAAVDESRSDNGFPASVAGVIPVANERLSAARSGVYIAPGLDVPTTEPGGKWELVNGSSYAAAHVSGLLALLRQKAHSSGGRGPASTALGRAGMIDACAILARASYLAEGGCKAGN